MLSEIISRVRRNHALEHATIHVLTERYQPFSAQGNATLRGFHLNIYGDIGIEAVSQAVDEAYDRLQEGEKKLAVHPNCGTVLLTTATMAVLAAQGTFAFEQRRQKRSAFSPSVLFNALPSAVLAVTLALIISRPIGLAVQAAYTVEPELGDLRVVKVRKIAPSPVTRLFQLLLGKSNSPDVNAYHIETRG